MDEYLKHITPLFTPSSGCDAHRIVIPLTGLGMVMEYFHNLKFGDVIENTKILIFNRTPKAPIDSFLELRKKYGFKIIVDLDDYFELDAKHILGNWWRHSKMDKQIAFNVNVADEVIVTTNRLADKIRHLNPKIHVVPNALPFDTGQFNAEKNPSDKLRFMWAGGSSHFWDLQEIKTPFQKTLNDPHFANCEFILGGYDETNLQSKIVWDKMENTFSLNKRLRGYKRRGTLPINCYMDHYRECDVSVVPLEHNSFTPFKSNLKILEAGCKYSPIITSDTPPYSDEPFDFFKGSNAATWYTALKTYAKNPEMAKDHGQALGEYVREKYTLSKVNLYRKQLFENIISKG